MLTEVNRKQHKYFPFYVWFKTFFYIFLLNVNRSKQNTAQIWTQQQTNL